MAKDIVVGDEISYLADTCARCNELVPYYRKYCSRKCLSLDITDKQWNSIYKSLLKNGFRIKRPTRDDLYGEHVNQN